MKSYDQTLVHEINQAAATLAGKRSRAMMLRMRAEELAAQADAADKEAATAEQKYVEASRKRAGVLNSL